MSAVLLVMVVIIAALGLRTAGLVGIAIPGSFLAGILVLAALGFTINIVVLFALILAVGMLVDGAIVVTEYADRKMMEGEPHHDIDREPERGEDQDAGQERTGNRATAPDLQGPQGIRAD